MAASDDHPAFSVDEERSGDSVVLSVHGELDLSVAGELDAAIARAVATADMVQLDLGDCTFVDSTAMKVMVKAARELRARDGELSVTNVQGDVERLFEITGLLLEGSALVHRPSA